MANVMTVDRLKPTKTKTTKTSKKNAHRRRPRRRRERPTLRFTPYAWSKLLHLRDAGPTEVGGFGIARAGDLLLVEDMCLVDQRCTAVSVQLEDAAVADFFDQQVDAGRRPEQFGRIWIHTHPGSCPRPSATDEETFARCFGGTDWAVMFILAADGATYARLQFHIGPQCRRRLRVDVDYATNFAAASFAAWDAEYDDHVLALDPFCASARESAATYFRAASPQTRTPDYGDVIDEWYARGDAVDLFPKDRADDPSGSDHGRAFDESFDEAFDFAREEPCRWLQLAHD